MKRVTLEFQTRDKQIEYCLDLDSKRAIVKESEGETVLNTDESDLPDTDKGRQDLALRLYHLILASLRE